MDLSDSGKNSILELQTNTYYKLYLPFLSEYE